MDGASVFPRYRVLIVEDDSVSAVVLREVLERTGRFHVCTIGDPEDARAVRLEATAQGTKLLQQGRRRRIKRLAAALQTLTPEELEVLARAAAIVERVSATI